MANGKMVITEDAWKFLSLEEQTWIIYTTLLDHDRRICALEQRGIKDRLYSFAGGIIGGIVAFWVNLLGGGGGTPHP